MVVIIILYFAYLVKINSENFEFHRVRFTRIVDFYKIYTYYNFVIYFKNCCENQTESLSL